MKHDKFVKMKFENGGSLFVNTEYITSFGYLEEHDQTVVTVLGEGKEIYFQGDQTNELLKEQEQKTGYWKESAGALVCSVCGATYSDLYPDYGKTHFCPNCGAKMENQKD